MQSDVLEQLPTEARAVLRRNYANIRLLFRLGPLFVVEGLRVDTSILELVEGTSVESKAQVKLLQREFEICRVDPENSIKAIDSEHSAGHYFTRYSHHGMSLYQKYVLTDPYLAGDEGLDMLNDRLPPIPPLSEARLLSILRAGIDLCDALQKLHDRHILHNNINSHSVFATDGKIVLRSRGSSANMTSSCVQMNAGEESSYPNLLPYLSPEASGRTSEQPDFRSDIYSVGCTMYEILTGRPPLLASDQLSFIHRHLTTIPTAINDLIQGLPVELGAVISKCLEKSPDKRYHTVAGLRYDLQEVTRILHLPVARPFQLASLDDLMRFQVAETMCGRESESAKIEATWHRVLATQISTAIVISGGPGIGKSRFISDFLSTGRTKLFAAGKYQLSDRVSPFHALMEALQNALRQILAHNQNCIKAWRAKLSPKIDLVRRLSQHIPELKVLLNEHTDGASLPITKLEDRQDIREAFVFILSVLSSEGGLVLVQDDVQWASAADLDFTLDMVSRVPKVLLILAHGLPDVDSDAKLAWDNLRFVNAISQEIRLDRLSLKDVQTIIVGTLHDQNSSEIRALAQWVHNRAEGNPREIEQLLLRLHRSSIIYFQVSSKRWRFDIAALEPDQLTSEVIEVVKMNITAVAKPVENMLMTAAALGEEFFSAIMLTSVLGQTLAETLSHLEVAVDYSILKSTDVARASIPPSHNVKRFCFLNDVLQEYTYGLLAPTEQSNMHYSILSNIKAKISDNTDEQNIYGFVLANQYNRCIKYLSLAEKEHAVECNIFAGRLALKTGDPSTAIYYFEIAEHLSEMVQNDISTRLTIRFGMIDANFAASAYHRVLDMIHSTFPFCVSQRDITRCYQSELKTQMALGHLSDAVTVGLSALDKLNCPIPGNDHAALKFSEKMAAELHHNPESIMELVDAPSLVDDVQLQIQEVLTLLILPVYMTRPALLSSLCYLSLSITTNCGTSLEGAYPAMMLGAYLSSIGGRQNLLKSFAYGKFALRMLEKAGAASIAPGMYHLFAGHIAVFHQPMAEVMKYEDLAIATGKAAYNIEYTVFSLVEKPVFLAWSGQNLRKTLNDLRATKEYILSTKSTASDCFLAVHMNGIASFSGLESDASSICAALNSTDPGETIKVQLSLTHAFMWELWVLLRIVVIDTDDDLRRCIRRCCIEYCQGVLGTHYAAMGFWIASVAILTRLCLDLDVDEDELRVVESGSRMLRGFAEFAPSTFSAKVKLIDCLSYRTQKNHDGLRLLDMYEDVALEADLYGCHLEKALAMESAARWLASVSAGRSQAFIIRSHHAYKEWGCDYKLSLLEKEFPFLSRSLIETHMLTEDPTMDVQTIGMICPPASKRPSLSRPVVHGSSITTVGAQSISTIGDEDPSSVDYNKLSELDMKTILNSSIRISKGMKAEEVFENLMRTVLLAAGANYGVLALHNSDAEHRLDLHIHTVANGDSIRLMNNTPALDRADLLPLSIVNTVLVTQKPIILNGHQNTSLESSFRGDRYFESQGRSLKSVLCMPILFTARSEARGVLYLENNVTSSAFKHQRLECLTLLCEQSAVMLERAGIYHEMQAAKAQAEEATAQKSTFLSNMSHEIRTPFNALLSCAIFLLDTSLTQVQEDYVVTIRDSATLTLSIIDDILDFSKVEQGKMELVLSHFSLTENIEAAMQIVAQKASTAGVDLVFSQKHNTDQIVGDSHHLRQVILNLLSNAVKFTSQGYVKITAKTQQQIDAMHQRIVVVVEDTGIGISPRGLDRLFKAFSQVDASINRSYGGTGLGLAISKSLVELMGGKIWVESIENRGTTFSFEIPVKIDAPSATASAPMEIDESPAIKKQGRLALVVSRFHATADVLVEDLTRMGLTTDKNTKILDADAIAKAAKAKPYSLLFVDLQVEGALDLVQSLQKILPSRESHFKIVVLTNYGLKLPKDMCSARIAGYLVKPVTKKKLRDLVSECLSEAPDDEGNSEEFNDRIRKPKNDPRSTSDKQNSLRILLAEDNIINTKVALQHLKRLGYTDVVHAKDGVEVLEFCDRAQKQQSMFDLILMDVQMPRLDGIGATVELIKSYPEPASRPVIIALTANATSSDKQRCLDAGMSEQCSKPILPDDLQRALNFAKERLSKSTS